MFIEKGILVKGIASLGVVGAAIGGYVGREQIRNLISGSSSKEESSSLLDRAGIKCDGENGCVLGENKTLTIKKGDVTKEVNALSSSTGAKITLEKLEGESDYNEGLKFTVKGGNISLGTESPIILENTETYELKEEGGKYIFLRKNVSTNKVIPSLLERAGITCSEQSGCVLGNNKTIVIRQESSDKEVNSLSSSTGAKITLEKLTGENDYNENHKFTVTGGNITLGTETPVTLEETETYELTEENGKFILSRKSKSTMKLRGDLKFPKECPKGTDSALTLECTIGLADPKNIKKGKEVTPPSEVEDLMNKWGITLPKDLRDLGRTPDDRLVWNINPPLKYSSSLPKQ